MTDMKEEDAGLVVTCVKPLYCPGANKGKPRRLFTRRHSNNENFKFTHGTALSVTTEETAKYLHSIHETNNATIYFMPLDEKKPSPTMPCEFVRWEQH